MIQGGQFFFQFRQLFFQLESFQARKLAQADFQNVFGLNFAQVKRLHQLGFRLVRLANYPNHFVNV